jgi:predicted DsbA family dithiol-disulfide isomerase
VRLRRLEEEFGDDLAVEWRSFLLRPRPGDARTLDDFRAYTQSWMRPAAEPDAGTFRVWATDAGPPSHSMPPHLVAKAAATLGRAAFRAVHERLLHAYFADNRDITDAPTLAAIWAEAGLPPAALARAADPAVLDAVVDEHNAAVKADITGVPAVLMEGTDVPLLGAHPLDVWRRWIRRALAATGAR